MGSLAPTIYPHHISRACSALDESPAFTAMPDGFIRVILRIIKKINLASPRSPIFASRSTIAAECGKSVETVQRAIRWLEFEGLVEREQIANPGKRGSKSPLTPTQKFLEAIGLFEIDTSRGHISKPSPGRQEPLTESVDVAKRSESKRPEGETRGNFIRIDGLAVPEDLAWLCKTHELPATGVLKLMRLAKEAKQRLSDVVGATKQYLEHLSGRQLYAYIQSLLGKGRDFGQVAREVAKAEETAETSEYLRSKAEIWEGRVFRNRDDSVVIRVVEGVLQVTKNGQRSVAFLSEKFLDSVEAGRFRESWPTNSRREADE